jgi:hypothetical protein
MVQKAIVGGQDLFPGLNRGRHSNLLRQAKQLGIGVP